MYIHLFLIYVCMLGHIRWQVLHCLLWTQGKLCEGMAVMFQDRFFNQLMRKWKEGEEECLRVCEWERMSANNHEMYLNVLWNAPNKSSPSNLREIYFLAVVCLFWVWQSNLFGQYAQSESRCWTFLSKEETETTVHARHIEISILRTTTMWQSSSYITSCAQLNSGRVPRVSTNLQLVDGNLHNALQLKTLCLMLRFPQVWDKPILLTSSKSWGCIQNGWGHPISKPHDGVQEWCGGMQGNARCGHNLD